MRQRDGEAEPLDAGHRLLPSQAGQTLQEGRQALLGDAEEGAVQKAPDNGAAGEDDKEDDGGLGRLGFHFQLQDYRGDEIDEAVARVAHDDTEEEREVDHDRETDVALVVAGHGVDEVEDDFHGFQPAGQIKERRNGGIVAVGLLVPESPALRLGGLDEFGHFGIGHEAFEVDDLAFHRHGIESAGVGVFPIQSLQIFFQGGNGASQAVQLFRAFFGPSQKAFAFQFQLFGRLLGQGDFLELQIKVFPSAKGEVDLAFRFGDHLLDDAVGRFGLLLFLAGIELNYHAALSELADDVGVEIAPGGKQLELIGEFLRVFRIGGNGSGELLDFLDGLFGRKFGNFAALRAVQKRVDDALGYLDPVGDGIFGAALGLFFLRDVQDAQLPQLSEETRFAGSDGEDRDFLHINYHAVSPPFSVLLRLAILPLTTALACWSPMKIWIFLIFDLHSGILTLSKRLIL